MKNHTLVTIMLVLMAFIMGFFTKDILHAIMNSKDTLFPASCTYGKLIYKSGEGFKSEDGCNSCSCQNGEVMCTNMACDNTLINPDGNDIESMPPTDGGEAGAMPSSMTCTYNGQTYTEGDSFASEDGCNTCGCSGGMVNCTLRACAQ